MKKLLILFFIFSTLWASAQVSYGGKPQSQSHHLPKIEKCFEFATIDADAFYEEDLWRDLKGLPPRYAHLTSVNLDVLTDGQQTVLPNKDKVYRLHLRVNGAQAIGLYFEQFQLAPGASMFVYSPDYSQVLGKFTHQNQSNDKRFATELIHQEEVVIEFYEPSHLEGQSKILLGEVANVYRLTSSASSMNSSDPCQVDVNCSPEGNNWQDEKRGVVRLSIRIGNSLYWCSGSVMNNTDLDCKPYVLTALHCGLGASTTDYNQWIFYFNYESSACGSGSAPQNQTVTGASMVANSNDGGGDSGSDFLLVELNSTIPLAYNTYYNGWNRLNSSSSSGVSIHHPAGDRKKISTYTSALSTTQWGSGSGSHWRVYWTSTSNGHGVTEGGSSGSPIFDASGRVNGTLTGGSSYCTSPNSPDYYGKMSYHWDNNGSANNERLKPWLDPANSNLTTLDGVYYPCLSVVYGCTDTEADNFDPFATDDDGSCIYLGCTDPIAVNYNLQANIDNGSCLYPELIINSPEAGLLIYSTDVTVNFTVNNFDVGFPSQALDGHIHYSLDGANSVMLYNTNALNFSSLTDGQHSLEMWLVDNNHIAISPSVLASVTFTIVSPIYGCTDVNASNYNLTANTDDGSCVYPDAQISLGIPTDLGNGTYLVDVILSHPLEITFFQFSISGASIVSQQGGEANANNLTINTTPNSVSGANGQISSGSFTLLQLVVLPYADTTCLLNPIAYSGGVTTPITTGSCIGFVLGCTDPTADNYDASATQDDGSCVYAAVCSAPTGLNTYDVVHTRATFNFTSTGADYYKIRVKENGGAWQVITQLGTATGTPGGSTKTKYFLTADASYEWQVRAWCIDGQVSGWSTSAFFNTLPACPNATDQWVSDVEAEWAVLNWLEPTNTVAGVNYYLARIQEFGASSWNIVTPANGGTDNFKLKGQLIPGATYNFETRTWCNTGDANNPTDPYYNSDWGGSASFTTIPCPVQTSNLYTTSVNATTQFFGADFIADANVPYDHFTLSYREVGATAWELRSITAAHIAAGGRNVGALTTGAEYEWGIRTFCGTGSTWKSPWESGPNFVVGGSSARLVAPVTALEVYPNPSRDIFNVSFTSEEAQTINVKVVNLIGEVMYSESLEDFQGYYEKGIDLSEKAKGVYFLEITAEKGVVNKKVILQ